MISLLIRMFRDTLLIVLMLAPMINGDLSAAHKGKWACFWYKFMVLVQISSMSLLPRPRQRITLKLLMGRYDLPHNSGLWNRQGSRNLQVIVFLSINRLWHSRYLESEQMINNTIIFAKWALNIAGDSVAMRIIRIMPQKLISLLTKRVKRCCG